MKEPLEQHLDEADSSQTELASVLGLTPSAVSNKIAGRRPWLQDEIDATLAFLSERLGRQIRYEDAFVPAAVATAEPEATSR